MEFKNIIGIDVGKETLEFTLLVLGEKKISMSVPNTIKKLEKFIKTLSLDLTESLFCMEHTGIYCLPLLRLLEKLKANVWIEGAMQIKKSIGLVRGKNDKIDSERIAKYALVHQKAAKLWQPEREIIHELKFLLAQRARLIKAKKIIEGTLTESKPFISKSAYTNLKQSCKSSAAAIKRDMEVITEKIAELIKSDATLRELNSYATSVPYIGPIIGATILVKTNEFKKINDPRKFACQGGIAPFEYSSGKSIRGKTRVSHLADKKIKTLMHLAAIGTISNNGELREYYERKLGEGKNKMLVINAIRNKLIHRIFACVNNKKKYQKNLLTLA
jgi:transposase